jgi:subtilisin family serine protease
MKVFLLITFNLLIINGKTYRQENDDEDFIDIGVRLTGDNRDFLIADLIAEEKDIINAGHINGIGLHHFRIQRKHGRRSKRAIDQTIEELQRDERIEFITIGESLIREKREFIDDDKLEELYRQYRQWKNDQSSNEIDILFDNSSFKMSFDDTYYKKQWYLENEGQLNTPAKHDINVIPAWLAGYSGKGVTISIIDDGLDHKHPELTDRYQPQFSYDLNDLNDTEHDPSPRTYDSANK